MKARIAITCWWVLATNACVTSTAQATSPQPSKYISSASSSKKMLTPLRATIYNQMWFLSGIYVPDLSLSRYKYLGRNWDLLNYYLKGNKVEIRYVQGKFNHVKSARWLSPSKCRRLTDILNESTSTPSVIPYVAHPSFDIVTDADNYELLSTRSQFDRDNKALVTTEIDSPRGTLVADWIDRAIAAAQSCVD